jgi:hypothetical protein
VLLFVIEVCYMKDVHIFEREVNGRSYRIAAESVWDSARGRSVARQAVLGPATAPPVADLAATRTVGTQAVGDVGTLIWVAEQLDLMTHIDRACGDLGAKDGPTVGEIVLAVAIQRACSPGPKRDLTDFLDASVPRLSCLPSSAFTGQAYYRVAQQISDEQLEQAQIAIAKAAVSRFELSADVLAFDTTNFDTHIATVTPGELARRGHAKSKRGDLRVVGLGVLVSETGHVPLLYRAYSGNSSDQAVLTECLNGLKALHESLDEAENRRHAQRTLVRDGGSWSPQLELNLDVAGYYTLISLPLGHTAAEEALQMAAKRGAMKRLTGKLKEVRAARMRTKVGDLDRTLVVVESQELLEGQKRGIAAALRKAKAELEKLERLVEANRIWRSSLEQRIKKTLAREHLSRLWSPRLAEGKRRLHSGGMWMRVFAANWKGPGWAGECCARINTCGAPAGSCTGFVVNGTSKNYFAGRRREAWCRGDRHISGRTAPYVSILLPP